MPMAWLSTDSVEGIKYVRRSYKVTITIYKATTVCKHPIQLVLFSFTKIVILHYTEQCTVKYSEMSQGDTAKYE